MVMYAVQMDVGYPAPVNTDWYATPFNGASLSLPSSR
jgi:hypothetical protein